MSQIARTRATPGAGGMASGLSLILVLLVLPIAVDDTSAITPDEFTGHWEGKLLIPNSPFDIKLDLELADEKWSGTIDIPAQGAVALFLSDIRVEDGNITFEIANIPGTPRFEGTLADGKIEGRFTQAGTNYSFWLSRDVLEKTEYNPDRPQLPMPPFPYREEEVSYSNADISLGGSLTLPQEGGPFPAVLLISGSGAQDRDESVAGHKPFLVIADHLTRAGIAVLRVDDRGVGKSGGNIAESVHADLAADVRAGVVFLAERTDIDAKRIGLLGHSEGGAIAGTVAAASDDVAFIVLMAATGVPGDEVLFAQLVAINRAAGVPAKNTDEQSSAQHKLIELIKNDADIAEIRAAVAVLVRLQVSITSQGTVDEETLDPVIEQQLSGLTSPWFRDFLRHDPRIALAKVRVAVLALFGELDLQVAPDQNLGAIENALKKAGNADVTVKSFPGLNHLFQMAKTGSMREYTTLRETINPEVLDTIRDWIVERSGG